MKTICPEGWTTAGHYAPGVISRGLLYISGQLPVDHGTGALVSGGAAAQAYSFYCGMCCRGHSFACSARRGAGRCRVLRQMGHGGDSRRYKGERGDIQLLFRQGVCGDVLHVLYDQRRKPGKLL